MRVLRFKHIKPVRVLKMSWIQDVEGYTMRVLRFGPSIVFIKPRKIGKEIENLFGVKPVPFNKALGDSQEFETILVPTESEEGTPFDADRSVYLIKKRADIVFKEIINARLPVKKIIVEAKHIILRVPANPEKAAEDIIQRYGGKRTGFAGGLMEGEEKDTLILITTKKLNLPLKMEDIDEGILIKQPFIERYRDLVVHLPIIMHKTMPEGWNELTIKVYDTEKRYEENLERLSLSLTGALSGVKGGIGTIPDHSCVFRSTSSN